MVLSLSRILAAMGLVLFSVCWVMRAHAADLHVDESRLHQLSTDPIWQLLVHEWRGQPQIKDSKFLLSADDYSAANELKATLALYRLTPQAAYCRFPARIAWLAEQQQLAITELPVQPCEKLARFQADVPFERLDLVFATEVLSSSTSMMGHVFFKASGDNADGIPQSHTLAYFTKIESLNPLGLLYDNTIGGMQGYMVVRPFNVDLSFYRDKEQRTVWQYKLPATKERLQLLQWHLYEIKDAQIDYYFQAYNCATLTLEVLAILKPEILQQRDWIVTPADVIKVAKHYQLVESVDVVVSKVQQFQLLRRELTGSERTSVEQLANQGSLEIDAAELYQNAAAEQYLRLLTNARIDEHKMDRTTQMALLQHWSADPSTAPDYTERPNPTETAGDSLWSATVRSSSGVQATELRWLANGHLLQGNNQHYQAESELMMGNIAVQYRQQQWQLSEFTLYSVTNLQATTDLLSRWAGRFYLGYHPVWTTEGWQSRSELSAAAGKSFLWTPDLTWYWLAEVGVASDFSEQRAFAEASTGLLWQLNNRHKLSASLQQNSGKSPGTTDYLQSKLLWHWQTMDNMAIAFEWQRLHHDIGSEQQIGVQWLYFY